MTMIMLGLLLGIVGLAAMTIVALREDRASRTHARGSPRDDRGPELAPHGSARQKAA